MQYLRKPYLVQAFQFGVDEEPFWFENPETPFLYEGDFVIKDPTIIGYLIKSPKDFYKEYELAVIAGGENICASTKTSCHE